MIVNFHISLINMLCGGVQYGMQFLLLMKNDWDSNLEKPEGYHHAEFSIITLLMKFNLNLKFCLYFVISTYFYN